ncbi:MAG: MFS transporter, partial [Sciscionella sp.]|nr:MFS transporter [Sciscionella sp.]
MPKRRLWADLRPLRESPDFRRLWAGNALSQVGSQMTTFAVALQVFTLTHSSLAVGAVGLCTGLSRVTFGLLAGSIVDAVDRRKLVLLTRFSLAGVSALLAAQAFAGFNQLWLLYCLVVLQSAISSISAPASQTFMPRLLRTELIPAGAALNMVIMHGSGFLGPALAGVITAAFGLKLCYLIDAISFVAALYGVFRLPSMPPEGGRSRPGVRAVVDGLRFIGGRKVLVGALLADMSATVFGV